jgi:capsular polysaccharide transport system permease protein
MTHSFGSSDTPSAILEAARLQLRVIGALVLRETRTRFGTSRLGYLWALSEPIVHVVVLNIVYIAMLRRPPTGTSLALFFITGIVPYFVFDKTATRLSGAISANRALLQLALVKNVDVILGRALLELGTVIIVFLMLMTGLYALGHLDSNVVLQPLIMAQAIGLGWLLGVGIGSINAVMSAVVKSWDLVYRMVTRPLYLLSGVFFMVERIPQPFSGYLRYNPVLHTIEMFRSAFYPSYGQYSIDVPYLAAWSFGTVALGFSLERLLRRRLSAGV